jgi:hypothetical protein
MRIRFVDELALSFSPASHITKSNNPSSAVDSKSRLSRLYFGSLSIQKLADLDRVVTEDLTYESFPITFPTWLEARPCGFLPSLTDTVSPSIGFNEERKLGEALWRLIHLSRYPYAFLLFNNSKV